MEQPGWLWASPWGGWTGLGPSHACWAQHHLGLDTAHSDSAQVWLGDNSLPALPGHPGPMSLQHHVAPGVAREQPWELWDEGKPHRDLHRIWGPSNSPVGIWAAGHVERTHIKQGTGSSGGHSVA